MAKKTEKEIIDVQYCSFFFRWGEGVGKMEYIMECLLVQLTELMWSHTPYK